VNRVVLSAVLIERAALRYTPAGLPALDLSLKHESAVMQNGLTRQVWFEIKARVVGELTQQVVSLELGKPHGFAGFLGSHRNGKGILFHITELDISGTD
jgi:primosomal replication protein N